MKVKTWLRITRIADIPDLRIDSDYYNPQKDGEKEIKYVVVQENGTVHIHTVK